MKRGTKVYFGIGISLICAVLLLWPYYRFVTQDLQISPLQALVGGGGVKTIDQRVNILILGIPGDPHEGPNLSDSIVVASYDMQKNSLVTINLPRDIWSPTLEDKINAAYALGEAKKKGSGMALARAEVAGVVGSPIYYAAVVDFSGFSEIIDELGGVDVEVERSYTDEKFPIAGRENDTCGGTDEEFVCRYEKVSFTKGKTHMDGATALKFVRSRNAIGAEGSDFARGKRQEKVIAALRVRITRELVSFNLPKLKKLYGAVDRTVTRNISNQLAASVLGNTLLKGKMKSSSYALSTERFRVPPVSEYGRYVLVPTGGNAALHGYIDCLIEIGDQAACDKLDRK